MCTCMCVGAIPQPMVEVQAEEENGEAVEEDFVYEEEFEVGNLDTWAMLRCPNFQN